MFESKICPYVSSLEGSAIFQVFNSELLPTGVCIMCLLAKERKNVAVANTEEELVDFARSFSTTK